MKIPKRFKLLGQTIEVVWDGSKFVQDTDCSAWASYRETQIQIKPPSDSHPRNEEQLEQTFCHELMHFILYFARGTERGKEELYRNENFVAMTAGLLHQALTTMEYDDVAHD